MLHPLLVACKLPIKPVVGFLGSYTCTHTHIHSDTRAHTHMHTPILHTNHTHTIIVHVQTNIVSIMSYEY